MTVPFSSLNAGDTFVIPDEKPVRLRVKKDALGDAYAYGEALPGEVAAFDRHLRENQRDCFSCGPDLQVLPIEFEWMKN